MLYLIATPIGNLGDMTYRAVDTLKNVSYILCEDTRTSQVLLRHYEIKNKVFAYHKFNENEMKQKIIDDLKTGLDVALISDAGMPGISDPGTVLVCECVAQNISYTVLPGASAFVNAMVLSGFNSPFTFIGFLPDKTSEKTKLLTKFKNIDSVLIFYMSPHSISDNLKFMASVLGNREICIARELTKKFETVLFSTLEKGITENIKGEFVVLVKPSQEETTKQNLLSVKEHLLSYINNGISKKEAITLVCQDRNMKKSDVYKESIDLLIGK